MPDLTSTTVAANYNKPKTVNGLGPKTTIISASKSNMTTAELHTLITILTAGGTKGVNDAFSVAGVATADGTAFESGVTDVVHIALQGTGVHTAASSFGGTSFTTAITSVFVNPF
jgi:hypothetical protein